MADGNGNVTVTSPDEVDVNESRRIEMLSLAAQARQDLLLYLLQGQRDTDDPETMMARAAQATASHLGANRVGFLETDSGDTFTVGTQWSDGTLPPLTGTFPAASLGAAYVEAVRQGRTLATADLDTDPLTSDSELRRAKVRSSLGAPIFRHRVWRGGLFVHHGTVRCWTPEETALVQDVANQTWDAVERARALAGLAEANAFTRLLLDSTTEAFYAVDADGVTTLCNRAFLDMLGFACEQDVVGRKLHAIIHHSHPDGSSYDAGDCPIYRAASAGIAAQVSEEVFFRQDGTSFPVEYRAAPVVKDGRVAGAICTFVDITERKRAEIALREMNESLELRVAERTRERDMAWRNSRDLQVVVGADGFFRAANTAWTSILGWQPDEVVGRHHLFFSHPDDYPASSEALAVARHGELPVYENRCLHKDGSYRWISWLAGPEEGLVYASGRHVTEEREARLRLAAAEEALRQSQKMEAVGQLTGGIAHDFNNMLGIVLGSLELLDRCGPGDQVRHQRHLDNALDGARRAALLTRRLLAFARQQPLRPEAVRLDDLVRGLAELLGRSLGSRVRLELHLAPDTWRVEVDVNQFENVLLNLAVNARDVMPDGGRLSIETRNVEGKSNDAIGRPRGTDRQFVLVAVTDTGSGMSPDVAKKAFEPFFTTKDVGKGTGLGLSQVYGFVTHSSGEVALSSEVGKGTTVSIYLPRLQDDGLSVSEPQALPEPVLPERTSPTQADDRSCLPS